MPSFFAKESNCQQALVNRILSIFILIVIASLQCKQAFQKMYLIAALKYFFWIATAKRFAASRSEVSPRILATYNFILLAKLLHCCPGIVVPEKTPLLFLKRILHSPAFLSGIRAFAIVKNTFYGSPLRRSQNERTWLLCLYTLAREIVFFLLYKTNNLIWCMYGHKEESFSWPQKPGSRIKTPVSAVFFLKTIAAFFPGRQY